MLKNLSFDLETDGFLKTMTRIHVLCIKDEDTNDIYVFRHNDDMNNVAEGIKMLEGAEVVVGHNIVQFDIPAIKKLYPTFTLKAKVQDTLVLARVTASNIKEFDIPRWKKGTFPGNLLGSHSLEAWGYRMNKQKGDYSKIMKEKGLDPWGVWSQDMEDYCVNDVIVTSLLYKQILAKKLPETANELEHEIHDIAGEMERNGFPFDQAAALTLAEKLSIEHDELRDKVISEYGMRFVPVKKIQILPYFFDPDGVNERKLKENRFAKPNEEHGEDYTRKWWGEVTVPKVNRTFNGFNYSKDLPYCKAKWVEFNPTSRQQITDRLIQDHGWEPQDFTETGQPSLDAAVLETLVERVPTAKDIGELFFLQKVRGQLSEGAQAWVKNYDPVTGCVHTRTNTGGAVTGRCTHSNFNVGQVPAVLTAKMKDKNGNPNSKLFIPGTTDFHPMCFDDNGQLKKEAPILGRSGEYGWECRSLFRVPDGWVQLGTDLSGIEFRCLAELTAEFDNGELIEVILTGDIHQFNMDKTGIPSRDIVKRVLYGLLYGAGDEKLGYTAKPTASPSEAKMIGRQLRAQLMAGLPALDKAIKKIKAQAKSGFLRGIDGRMLRVRSEHSALNTALQSAAALIAKKWLVIVRQKALDRKRILGWNDVYAPGCAGDFVMMAFIHDELQMAVAPDLVDEFAELTEKSAADAGLFFNFKCPIGAQAKVGMSWAECH